MRVSVPVLAFALTSVVLFLFTSAALGMSIYATYKINTEAAINWPPSAAPITWPPSAPPIVDLSKQISCLNLEGAFGGYDPDFTELHAQPITADFYTLVALEGRRGGENMLLWTGSALHQSANGYEWLGKLSTTFTHVSTPRHFAKGDGKSLGWDCTSGALETITMDLKINGTAIAFAGVRTLACIPKSDSSWNATTMYFVSDPIQSHRDCSFICADPDDETCTNELPNS